MHNNLFVSLLFIITLASCSPSTALQPTVTNSTLSTAEILPPSTSTSVFETSTTVPSTKSPTQVATATPWPHTSLVSPNGEFIANAYFETDLPSEIQTIEILNKEGDLIHQILYQGELPTSYPRPFLNIFQWSKDSSQLYFYYVWSPDGGDRAFWWTGYDLQKIDMKTGGIQYVLPSEGMMSFAISPDGTQMAYTRKQDQPSIFYIRDLSTGTEKTAYVLFRSKNYVRVGDIHWSPSGKDIVFQTETDDHQVQTILLNPISMKQKLIREYELFTMLFDGWTDKGKLQFSEISADGMQIDEVFQIDLDTKEMLVIGTPTPRP